MGEHKWSNRPHRMPPPEGPIGPLLGPNIEEFSVGAWCPTLDGSGPAEAVAISFKCKIYKGLPAIDFVMRIKSPMELDRVVQMLLRHKRDVWPDAP